VHERHRPRRTHAARDALGDLVRVRVRVRGRVRVRVRVRDALGDLVRGEGGAHREVAARERLAHG